MKEKETGPELEQPPTEEFTEQPAAEQPKPETVGVRVELLVEDNEKLKSLATLWGQTKALTAWKLLTGSVQHQFNVNKLRGRL
ncbi:hypothetical protein ES703_15814 [subsurface metagenome]